MNIEVIRCCARNIGEKDSSIEQQTEISAPLLSRAWLVLVAMNVIYFSHLCCPKLCCLSRVCLHFSLPSPPVPLRLSYLITDTSCALPPVAYSYPVAAYRVRTWRAIATSLKSGLSTQVKRSDVTSRDVCPPGEISILRDIYMFSLLHTFGVILLLGWWRLPWTSSHHYLTFHSTPFHCFLLYPPPHLASSLL